MCNTLDIEQLYNQQLQRWEMAHHNYKQLDNVEVRSLVIDGADVRIQHNPGRIQSVSARIDKPQKAACFLCQENLPTEQMRLPYHNGEYHILVNPFPIFRPHYTIPAVAHTPQRIAGRMDVMLQLAHDCAPYTIFYNGPRCGASAPMHMHFQAAQAGYMPIERQWRNATSSLLRTHNTGKLSLISNLMRPIFVITTTQADDAAHLFEMLYDAMPPISDEEPMMNIMARYEEGEYILLVFPRAKHRPDCYYTEGNSQRLISPGTVEMGGLFITPRSSDYEKLTTKEIIDIYTEVSTSPDEINQIIKQLQKTI